MDRIEMNRNKFISFKDIEMKGERALTVSEKILAKSYYTFRNLRGFIQNFKK